MSATSYCEDNGLSYSPCVYINIDEVVDLGKCITVVQHTHLKTVGHLHIFEVYLSRLQYLISITFFSFQTF